MVREYVWLECGDSGQRNYRTSKETRGTERLELKKYCKKLRRHTVHNESRKKKVWRAAPAVPGSLGGGNLGFHGGVVDAVVHVLVLRSAGQGRASGVQVE